MKTVHRYLLCVVLLSLSIVGCSGEKKIKQYGEIYHESPAVIYVAPLNDKAMRHAVRELNDSIYNASINIAAKQLYLTAADPLVAKGYYVPGPLVAAQMAAAETRSGKQLRNESINDYHTDLGVDAILFIDLIEWRQTYCTWSVVVEYVLRSTRTNSEILHVWVDATKHAPTDLKGNPIALPEDEAFAKKYGCDFETAQRCRLVETVNKFVLKDLPSGERARKYGAERYTTSHPEYFYMRIERDGSIVMLNNTES